MKLYTKISLGFGSLWGVFLVATLMILTSLHQQGASLQDAFRNNFDSVVYCGQITQSFDTMNQVAMASTWTHSPPDQKVLALANHQYEESAEGQRQSITLPGEDALTRTLFDKADAFRSAMADFTAAPETDRGRRYQADLRPRYLDAREASLAINKLNFDHLRQVNARLQKNLDHARLLQIVFVLVGAALAIASALILAKTILGPLHSLMSSAREVEAGNLDFQVPVHGRDELGELALAFNAMASRLREYRELDAARLRRTQQTTQLAIDSLPDAVAVLNTRGEVEISNRQARLHFGLDPETNGIGSKPTWLSELIAGPLSTGRAVEPQGYESAIQLFDDGEERFLLPRAEAMFSEGNAIIGVVVTLVDVTRLRRADELKSGLLATVSHDLKTPLAATRFSVQLLAKESVAPLDERQRRLVNAACEGADRLHRMIENVLQLQRFEQGRQQLQLSPVDPRSLIDRIAGAFRDEYRQHGLELAAEVSPDLPKVLADPGLIEHVGANLLSNALKFVGPGGHVAITARLDADQVEFAFADDGPGIPAEHIPHLFTRFYRATAPSGVPGAGLGLFISRQLVEAQGGHIAATSREGGGACFTFTLKIANTP